MPEKKEIKNKPQVPKQDKKPENPLGHLPKTNLTFGQKAADKLTIVAGSWGFIFSVLGFIAIWMFINIIAWVNHWDPYPFILLNLFLSCLAAIQAPVILMSQNREAQRDRLRAEYDYAVNRKAERGIEEIKKDIRRLERKLSEKRK